MKDFLKSNSVKFFLSTVFIVVLLSVFTSSIESNLLSSTVNSVTYPLSKVTAAATGDEDMTYAELLAEYEALKEENAQLRTQLVDYYDTLTENTRLWKFYDLKKEHPEYTLVPSVVLRKDSNDEFYSFTLDKGTTSDIAVGDPVVSENGLIGWVNEVDLTTCKVVTILSPQTSVGAIDSKSQDTGIITGSALYCDENLTTFTKLSAEHKVKAGDIITSTGISGLYPKGLIIGEVTDICYDTYNTSYYAVVKPYVDIRELKDLAIITDYTGQGEVLIKNGTGTQ
ncbi:MAG: rod shape-determining protein MreC [Ruminococcus sp.]|nr:rod shape-determining protein MreC [Ruminococcus sp.]